jgi:hypothetical protein
MTTGIEALGRLFTPDKTIDSYALNRLGAQVLRTVIAHGLYNVRPIPVPEGVAEQVSELKQQGILVLRNFLPPDELERVRAEARVVEERGECVQTIHHGFTRRLTVPIRNVPAEVVPAMHRFFLDPRLEGILTAAEQRPLGRLVEHSDLEVLLYDELDAHDIQTDLHSDCFYNTHKVWFYLSDVGPNDGPLVYVKGSNVLTLERLGYIYRESWDHAPDANASRRISEDEQRTLQETVLTVPANTLVIVNTCGYHRRIAGVPGRRRTALSFFLRANPFAPHALHSAVARHPRVYQWLRNARARRRQTSERNGR